MEKLKKILDQSIYEGDPLADQCWAQILGDIENLTTEGYKSKMQAVGLTMMAIKDTHYNKDLSRWRYSKTATPEINKALGDFFHEGAKLPDWANQKKIEQGEEIFSKHGSLSIVLFFCASLPESYVHPNISKVLSAAGGFEKATEQRIRNTSALILGGLLKGGIHDPDSSGLVRILKTRLLHSLVRYLILRGPSWTYKRGESIDPIKLNLGKHQMFESLYSLGWEKEMMGIPVNQEETAYVLLTFSYVFLRCLKDLGIGLSKKDEAAYLHIWNVMGHVLGINSNLMANNMDEAKTLFDKIQKRARARDIKTDSRIELSRALLHVIENVIAIAPLKPMAAMIIKYLCGKKAAQELGIQENISPVSLMFLSQAVGSFKITDMMIQKLFSSKASLVRLMVRVVGYHLLARVFALENYPLDLTPVQELQVRAMLDDWSHDKSAPAWINKIEAKLTTKGSWKETLNFKVGVSLNS